MEMQEIIILYDVVMDFTSLHFYMILLHDMNHVQNVMWSVTGHDTWYMISTHYRLNWCCLFHFACTCTSLCHNGVVQYSMVYDLFILWSERAQCRVVNWIELNWMNPWSFALFNLFIHSLILKLAFTSYPHLQYSSIIAVPYYSTNRTEHVITYYIHIPYHETNRTIFTDTCPIVGSSICS